MKREFLEELGLEKEVIDKIMDENGKGINAEKAKTSTKEQEIQVLNNQLKEANKSIKSYKDMDIDKIKESASDWENKFKESQKEIVKIKNNASLEKALSETGSIDVELLSKIIDRDTLKFTEDGITGLKEQIDNLKETKPYLFKEDNNNQDNGESNDNRFNAHEPPTSSGGSVSTMEATIDSIFNI